ncbi:D-alanyl-D-alanine carboxypeptidase, partial [Kibdelosporangium lantanae]
PKLLASILAVAAAPDAKVLGEIRSAPLAELIDNALQISDNVLAETVARELAKATGEEPSFAGVTRTTLKVLQDNHFDVSGVKLIDGSGLSTVDLATPKLLASILAVAAGVYELTTTLRKSAGIQIAFWPVLVGGEAMVWLAWPFERNGVLSAFVVTILVCLMWRFRGGTENYLRSAEQAGLVAEVAGHQYVAGEYTDPVTGTRTCLVEYCDSAGVRGEALWHHVLERFPTVEAVFLRTPPARPLVELTNGWLLTGPYRLLGRAPRQVVKWAFQLTSVDKYVTKPVAVLTHLDDTEYLAQIEAVDRFMDNMAAYPGRTFGQLYHRFFRGNDLHDGVVDLAGRLISLASIEVPVLVVAGATDGIAPEPAVRRLTMLLDGSPDVRFEVCLGETSA